MLKNSKTFKVMTASRIIWLAFIVVIALNGACKDSSKSDSNGKTSSGLPYVIHIDSAGPTPEAGDKLRFHLQIRNQSNQILAKEDMTGILPGLDPSIGLKPEIELLYLMSPGDSASLKVFGEPLQKLDLPNIHPGDTLIYEIGLAEIVFKKAELEKLQSKELEVTTIVKNTLNEYNAGTLGEKLITTKSGLKYVLHEEGEGPLPASGNQITIEYYGAFLDGTPFDNSWIHGEPLKFNHKSGAVLPGLDEGLDYIKEGSRVTFIIPYALAFGPAGSPPYIPEKTDIVFYIELIKVSNQKLFLGQ